MLVHQSTHAKLQRDQYLNYLALALIDLTGNEMPMEEEIQAVEQELELIVEKYSSFFV